MLSKAYAYACSDPLDHLQVSKPLITCVFHLSIQLGLIKWINEMNCSVVTILINDLSELEGCQPLLGTLAPFEPFWVMIQLLWLAVA
jgi:hypothetical protein